MSEDVQNQGKRTQGHHTDWEFPYVHVLARLPDGSVIYANSKIPQNGIIYSHGTSGTYVEINNSGDVTSFTVGNKIEYNKSGTTVTVKHNGDVSISGHQRMMIGGDAGGLHIEVAGDAGITVGGDTAIVGMGKVAVRGKNMYIGSDQDIAMNASGNMDIKVAGDFTINGSTVKINSSGGFTS